MFLCSAFNSRRSGPSTCQTKEISHASSSQKLLNFRIHSVYIQATQFSISMAGKLKKNNAQKNRLTLREYSVSCSKKHNAIAIFESRLKLKLCSFRLAIMHGQTVGGGAAKINLAFFSSSPKELEASSLVVAQQH